MNNKGDFTGIIYLVVSISAFAIFLLIVAYIVPQIANPLKEQIGKSTLINNSIDSSINVANNTLPSVWLIVFICLLFGLFITAFFIETHPVFVPIFILLLVIAIIIAIPLSNAYEQLSETSNLQSTSVKQVSIKFIISNLPLVTFIIGLIIMVIAFAKPGEGGSTLA